MATTDIDAMLQRQAERLERREDPEPAAEQAPAEPPKFDATKATPGAYRLAVVWKCDGCGADRQLLEDGAINAALNGATMGLTCGAEVPDPDARKGFGEVETMKCGHQMSCRPGFGVQKAPQPGPPALNRHDRRALAAFKRKG